MSLSNRNVRSVTGKQERQECHWQTGTSGVSLSNRNVGVFTSNQGRQWHHWLPGTTEALSGWQKEFARCPGPPKIKDESDVSDTFRDCQVYVHRPVNGICSKQKPSQSSHRGVGGERVGGKGAAGQTKCGLLGGSQRSPGGTSL